MIDLPEAFKERMKSLLGGGSRKFFESYNLPPCRAIRVNTLKISAEDFKKISPFALEPVPWEPDGFYVDGESLGKTVLHAAGAYYVQEPSAMSVVPELGVKPGGRVLDLCAAPGGKGTQIASYMQGVGVLVLNEPVLSRRDILAQNAERLGVKNATITCAAPQFLSAAFENYFDKILVDAPCSGEGMFKKEPNAIPEWSLQNVEACALRQQKILAEADKMLCGGGKLVYSTCTFSPEEDEMQIKNFLASHGNYKLSAMKKLLPHEIRGEGHFFAALIKTDGERAAEFPPLTPSVSPGAEKIYREWERSALKISLKNIVEEEGKLYFFADGARDFSRAARGEGKGLFRSLMPLGTISQNRAAVFTPSHALAARLKHDEAVCLEVDERTAVSYLRGLTFPCPYSLKGWFLATYKNLPLGWCKAVNGTAKNHYPKGLRI